MVLVKICGITNLDDALAAVEAGADALGFNFYPPSPRYLAPEAAGSIIEQLPSELLTVGVFVNAETDAIREIAATSGVKALQLHGDESPAYCKALSDYYLIKVFGAGPELTLANISEYDVEAIMLDAVDHSGLVGGTGKLSDWSIAAKTAAGFPKLFLAGGLSPENVAEAIAAVKPYAVDACSRLENAPGRKDHERLRAFVSAVRKATT